VGFRLRARSGGVVTDAIDAIDATSQSFTRTQQRFIPDKKPDTCVDCHQPILDGSNILWKGQDRVCSKCAATRKLKEKQGAVKTIGGGPQVTSVKESDPEKGSVRCSE